MRWDSKNEGLSHQEICYVWLKMLLVSDLLHGGGVSASGPAAGATTNQERGQGSHHEGHTVIHKNTKCPAFDRQLVF